MPKSNISAVLSTVIAFSNIPDGGLLVPVGSIKIALFVSFLVPARAGIHIRS